MVYLGECMGASLQNNELEDQPDPKKVDFAANRERHLHVVATAELDIETRIESAKALIDIEARHLYSFPIDLIAALGDTVEEVVLEQSKVLPSLTAADAAALIRKCGPAFSPLSEAAKTSVVENAAESGAAAEIAELCRDEEHQLECLRKAAAKSPARALKALPGDAPVSIKKELLLIGTGQENFCQALTLANLTSADARSELIKAHARKGGTRLFSSELSEAHKLNLADKRELVEIIVNESPNPSAIEIIDTIEELDCNNWEGFEELMVTLAQKDPLGTAKNLGKLNYALEYPLDRSELLPKVLVECARGGATGTLINRSDIGEPAKAALTFHPDYQREFIAETIKHSPRFTGLAIVKLIPERDRQQEQLLVDSARKAPGPISMVLHRLPFHIESDTELMKTLVALCVRYGSGAELGRLRNTKLLRKDPELDRTVSIMAFQRGFREASGENPLLAQELVIQKPDEKLELMHESLRLGKIENVADIEAFTRPNRAIRRSEHEALIDKLTDSAEIFYPEEEEILRAIKQVREIGMIPNEGALAALAKANEPNQKFLLGIIGSYGESFGQNVAAEIGKVLDVSETITSFEREVIESFLQSGYRGFATDTYELYAETYRDDPRAALKMIDGWSEISEALLKGKEVSSELKRDPLYPSFVYGCYQPVGVSLGDTKRLLQKGLNRQEHLDELQIREDGYSCTYMSRGESSVFAANLDTKKLIPLFARTTTAPTLEIENEFLGELKKLAKGARDQVNPTKLLSGLMKYSKDPRIADFTDNFSEFSHLPGESSSLRRCCAAMRELYGVIIKDAISEVIPKLAKELKISDKAKQHIRKQFKLSKDDELPLETVLQDELDKVFEPDRRLLTKTLKQFRTTAGEEQRITGYISKADHSYFARAAAGLCTAHDTWSWDEESFLQMNFVDHEQSKIVANIQLHLFTDQDGNESVLARLNPTQRCIDEAEPESLAKAMLESVLKFVSDNGLRAYLPEQTDWHELTNRPEFEPAVKRLYGDKYPVPVRVAEHHVVENIRTLEAEKWRDV